MKTVVGTSLALLFLCSCGEEEQLDLGQGQVDNFKEAAMRESCDEPIVAYLMPPVSNGYSPTLVFYSKNRELFFDAKLEPHHPTDSRCTQLYRHFNGRAIRGDSIVTNELRLAISFNPTAEQETQLLLGKAVSIRPDEASLVVTDGSLNSTSTDLELRCPGSASVSCRVKDLGEYKKCDAYDVKFTGQCSFRSKLLLYSFADHNMAQMEVMGELETSEQGGEIKFTKLSWLDVN